MSEQKPRKYKWLVEDYSMAVLIDENSEHQEFAPILSVSPCSACRKYAKQKAEGTPKWEWGRCHAPTLADAELICIAVNNHTQLVSVLARMLNECNEYREGAMPLIDEARALLKEIQK